MGHPTIVVNPPTTDIAPYFGLVKCTILPPRDLYHPVLPYRCLGKLTFPLCATCSQEQRPLPLTTRRWTCSHSIAERCLTGTWCTPELQEALNRGYRIQQVHEVWHFPRHSVQLFQTYVNTFLKIKQEASRWPDWVGDDPQKRTEYVANYRAKEGVELAPENIAKNPGRRSLAKLMLNSFWGKYGQQSNKTQVDVFSSPAEFYKLLLDDTTVIKNLRVVTPEMVEASYQNIDDADPVQVNINIFVACFTTCWARLKLYREGLSPLEPQQVLYFDTYSIIYSRKPDQPELTLGDYLGEFTSELDPGDTIVEFASAGPKNYAYVTAGGKVECKVRGFSLNARGQAQLNFSTLKNNVIDEVTRPDKKTREIAVWNPHRITRDVNHKQLLTETEIKRYKLVVDKRVVDPESFFSYPYGYSDRDPEEEEMEALLAGDNRDTVDQRNVEHLLTLLG